jgi:hypothetical protein
MRKPQPEPTTAANLEAKFNRGADVVDYFDVKTIRVVSPRGNASGSVRKEKASAAAKASPQKAVVRERSGRYRARHRK